MSNEQNPAGTAADLDAALTGDAPATETKAAARPKRAPAKKTTAKKTPTKAPARKTAAKPATKTAEKPAAPAKAPAAKKTVAKKTPASKPAAPAKAPARKPAATKTPAKQPAAPAAAPAKAPAGRPGRQQSPMTVAILELEVGQSHVVVAELNQLNRVQAQVQTVIGRTVANANPKAKFEINRATVVAPVTGAKVRYAILVERVK